MQTGCASRSLERSSLVIWEDPTVYPVLSNWTLSIFFSVELIPSMRASGRAARYGGMVSICELTQTGSPRRDRDACTRPPIYVHVHFRIRIKVDPPTGRCTLIQKPGATIFLTRSFTKPIRLLSIYPSFALCFPSPHSCRAVLPCAR